MMKKWSKDEENILINIPKDKLDLYKLVKILNRPIGSICKKIYRLRGIDLRNSIVGTRRRAVNHYNLIKTRLKTSHIVDKNKTYKSIQLKVSKNDFVEWFMKRDFVGCSVDRIDSKGDYSLDNMQVISLADNIRKEKIKEHNGLCECYRCHKIKPIEEFAVNKKRLNGHTTICKICDSKRKCKNKEKI